MKISYKWLRQYVDCPLTPDQVAAALTQTGLETDGVEEVESIRGGLRGVVIGKVLTCEPHPDSDHLHVTTVDLGAAGAPGGKPVQIVCGAPNVAAGQTVVVATVGATLHPAGAADDDKGFQIKRSKIRGVESLGMICAEDEIGVGTSHSGIIVIDPEKAPAPGTPAAEFYSLSSDYVMEVDLTPNRVDGASHYGTARDLNAYLCCHLNDGHLHRPPVEAFRPDRPDGAVAVQVDDTEGVTRYAGVTIRGVRVGPSPHWLQQRLAAIGCRPINNVVDITNYILHGFCQPLHCFDLAHVKGGRVVVRTVATGTPFVTLDGVERRLDQADVMICNAEEPMCIGGVFGGLDSGVTEATTDIFLESACFNPTRIRRTARRHGLQTDASFRFERGVDPNGVIYALKLAALMVKEMAGGEICGDIVDVYPRPVLPARVRLSYAYLDSLIGKHIPAEQVRAILRSLDFGVVAEGDGETEVEVPTYRVDVTRPCDVAEEVLRIYGYDNVDYSTTVHSSLQFKTPTDASDDLRRRIADQLCAQGYNEILNNSLTAERYYEGLATWPASHCVRLLNPLSSDLSVMRQTLLFGGLETVAHNVNRRMADLALYEFGNVYRLDPDAASTAQAPLAPYRETASLALWLTGNSRRGNWARPSEEATFFDLKAACADIFGRLGLDPKEVRLEQDSGEADVYAASLAVTTRSGKPLGRMGLLNRAVCARCEVEGRQVCYAEFDWDALVKLSVRKKVEFRPLPKTQGVDRDLALLLDCSVTMAQVEAVIQGAEKKLLRSVELFDVYEGKNLPAGKKSYAVSLVLRDDDHTLQERQIDQAMERIISALKSKLGAELR